MGTMLKVPSTWHLCFIVDLMEEKTLMDPNASISFPNIVICQRHSAERKGIARDIYTWSNRQFKTNVNQLILSLKSDWDKGYKTYPVKKTQYKKYII